MNKLVNTDLSDEQLELANWFIENVSEFRQWSDNNNNPQLLAFVSLYDMRELGELLKKVDRDFFTESSLECHYNGSDLVIDIMSILEYDLDNLDPKLIYEEWRADDEQ